MRALAALGESGRGAVELGVKARKRAVQRAMAEVSHYLGNTPAVARASYVDPRVVDLFHDGRTIEAHWYSPRRRTDRHVTHPSSLMYSLMSTSTVS